jgi:RNA polymerase sigma factor (sigma-70 family)
MDAVARALLLGGLRPAGRVEIAMSASIPRKEGQIITQEAFDRMLAALGPDIDRAGEQYEKIRRKLVKFFCWRGCPHVAEECADETFNRVAQKISDGTSIWANDPYTYFYGVALNVLREYLRRAEQTAKTLEDIAKIQDFSVDPEDVRLRENEQWEKERMLECLNQCVKQLPPETINLITRYHQGEEVSDKARRKELAHSLGIPPNALRIRAYRIRVTIEECVRKCLGLGIVG